ncbi:urate hydroxylase PuuD [Hyphococcus flavus]|uniref:Urate hydroxylase PuuD n=1 Tax=Hyphococcus flavus TaxID=1866326 RepID=A0AAF0CFJ6_9PROT|nr:urate hydroxylase PuuD [Hyphococcus flavus]WDI31469.1 urate hydroxylase PuuD [Hyphococcus flavus]
MAALLTNLRNAVITGVVLAALLVVLYAVWGGGFGQVYWMFFFRWLHVLAGVMWIGLLWYFNFVQIPTMPSIPDDQKPAIGKHIAPKALWWFRWGAMATIVTGLILATLNGYILNALTLGLAEGFVRNHVLIGIGMWLGAIMWFNVWFIIWPNQIKALNIDNKHPDLAADAKAASAKKAMLFSRTNTVLSIPMLFCMVAAQNL